MFLMDRLVSRGSRSLAVMLGAASSAQGRGCDYLRGKPAFDFGAACRSCSFCSTPQYSIRLKSE
jgi:hypothetical protein